MKITHNLFSGIALGAAIIGGFCFFGKGLDNNVSVQYKIYTSVQEKIQTKYSEEQQVKIGTNLACQKIVNDNVTNTTDLLKAYTVQQGLKSLLNDLDVGEKVALTNVDNLAPNNAETAAYCTERFENVNYGAARDIYNQGIKEGINAQYPNAYNELVSLTNPVFATITLQKLHSYVTPSSASFGTMIALSGMTDLNEYHYYMALNGLLK